MKIPTKLTLLLVTVAAVSAALTGYLAFRAADDAFDQYIQQNYSYRTELLAENIAGYYRQHGSFEGVGYLFRVRGGPMMMMMGNTEKAMLVDNRGVVIAASDPARIGEKIANPERGGIPIEAGGTRVGTLVVESGRRWGLLEQGFYESLRRATLMAVTAVVLLSALLGPAVARHLTRPLALLADAARRFGRREFDRRVPVRGRDEIAELGLSFNQMADDLLDKERLRQNLFNDVAHELRTPLAILRANLEAIQEGVTELTMEEVLSLHDEVVRISNLVADLNELSLAEAGHLKLNPVELDPVPFLRETGKAFVPEAQQAGVDFGIQVPDGLPGVKADPVRLKQVLQNLLINALKHTPPGGRIVLSASPGLGELLVSVSDTGEGIPPDELPHIFDRFYRARNSKSGTGLGLAIARGIVDLHGGRIWAESVPGKGATFTFTIPLGSGDGSGA